IPEFPAQRLDAFRTHEYTTYRRTAKVLREKKEAVRRMRYSAQCMNMSGSLVVMSMMMGMAMRKECAG
ncbi:MAG: hypothetical protein ACLFRR_04115, partial [Spirochaetaceae bacterium]